MPRRDLTCRRCGLHYDRFRTGLTFGDVYSMLWSHSDDPKQWRYKTRAIVLGLWHQMKQDMWKQHENECDGVRLDEEWRAVPSFEGYYEVSNLGRVRSLTRVIVCANGSTRTITGQLMSPQPRPNGYTAVRLRRPGTYVMEYVHRLVMTAFRGPPRAGYEVDHRDEKRDNNVLSNLRYMTRGANVRRGREKHRGTRNGYAKLTDDDVRAIRASSASVSSLARQYNVSTSNIYRVKRRELWAHIKEGT